MRRFWLESETGDRLALQHGDIFFYRPEGLGSEKNTEYFETGHGFYAPVDKTYEQANIVGTLLLSGEAYATYQDFVDWVYKAGTLTLVYQPTGQRELLMDVDVESLGLSEKTRFGLLEVPVSLRGKTPYYTRANKRYDFLSRQGENIKLYTYRYSYMYSQSGEANTVEIDANELQCHFPAGLEFRAVGPISKPVLTAKDAATGALIGRLDLTGLSLEEGETLYWSSKPNETAVRKNTAAGKEDLVGLLDLSNNNFFQLPQYRAARITFTADIDPLYEGTLTHTLTLHKYLRG